MDNIFLCSTNKVRDTVFAFVTHFSHTAKPVEKILLLILVISYYFGGRCKHFNSCRSLSSVSCLDG